MKKAAFALSLIALTLGWVACKKKEQVTPPVQTDTVLYLPGVHATVNGTPWVNYNVDYVSVPNGGHHRFEFGGTDTNSVKVSIYIDDATGTGVHNLTATSADKAYYIMDTGSAPVKVYATSGQINITALNDSNVQGTFDFVADSNTVTNGTFNIKF